MEIRKTDSKGRISIGVPGQHFYVHWDAGRITLAPVAGITPDLVPEPHEKEQA